MRRAQSSHRSVAGAAPAAPVPAVVAGGVAPCRPFVRRAPRSAIVLRAPSPSPPRLSIPVGGQENRRACCARRPEEPCPGDHRHRGIYRSRCHLLRPPISAAVLTNSPPPAASVRCLSAPRLRPTGDRQRNRRGRQRLPLVRRAKYPTAQKPPAAAAAAAGGTAAAPPCQGV